MNTLRHIIALAATLSLATAAIAGCGEGVECGPSTTKQNGACVPDTDTTCGPGTVADGRRCVLAEASCGEGARYASDRGACLPEPAACRGPGINFEDGRCVAVSECGDGTEIDEDGRCVPEVECPDNGAIRPDPNSGRCVVAAGGCGDGTGRSAQGTCVLDETGCAEGLAVEDGKCVPSDGLCGSGLALSEEGVCVPTDEVCGEAATFDEETGLCLPEESCKMGDVVLNGVCVSPAEKLAANADVGESENDDPRLAGSPTDLSAPDTPGDSSVFTGTIESPSDRDGNGTLDQDRDFFRFEGESGDWFELTVQSTGLPHPHAVVTGPKGFHRKVNHGPDLAAARHLVLPYDGTYRIRIVPDAWASGDDLGPVGGDDWGYVGSLEAVAPPSPQTVDLANSSASGDGTGLTSNLYQLQGLSSADAWTLTPTTIGDDLEATISIWKSPDTFVGTFRAVEGNTRTLPVPETDSGSFLMLVDWRRVDGTDVGYEIEGAALSDAESLGNPGTDGEATSATRDISTRYYYTFTVPAGQVAELTHVNGGDSEATLRLHDASGTEIEETTLDPRSASGNSTSKALYRYAPEATTYLLAVEPRFSFRSLTDVTVRLRTSTPADLGSAGPGDDVQTTVTESVSPGFSDWARLELTSAAGISGTISSHTPSDSSVEFTWRTSKHRKLDVSTANTSNTAEFDVLRAAGGTVLLEATPRSGDSLDEYATDLQIESPAKREREPNDLPVAATTAAAGKTLVGSTGSDDRDYFELQVPQSTDPGELMLVSIDGVIGANYSCRLENSNGDVVASSGPTEEACVLVADVDPGTYYLRVESGSDDSVDYQFEWSLESGLLESRSNNDIADADSFDYSSFQGGDRVFGEVGSSDTTDWYRFDLPSSLGADTYVAFDTQMLAPVSTDASYAQLVVELRAGADTRLAKGIVTDYGTVEGVAVRGLQSGTYYLKVSAANPDDIGERSGQYALAFDQTYTPDESASWTGGASIPDNDSSGISRQVNVSNCQTVDAVHLELSATHPDRADLSVSLEGPSGSSAPVKPAPNSEVLFGEPLGIPDIQNVFPLGAPVEESFDTFAGNTGNGTWTLNIADESDLSGAGELDNWRLNLTCR